MPVGTVLKKAKLPLTIASVVSGLCVALPSTGAIEEIVVTAQKREQGANDVGITLNAFSGEQLENFGVSRPDDLESMVPGLTVTQTQSAGAPIYTIRGVGFADFTTSATSTVGIYNDGASIPYPVMTRGVLFDVARVEVLKGPQGDLYGRNTTAGQINFVSNKPTEDFSAGVNVSFDTYNTVDVESFVSGALTDSVQGRLAIKSVNSDQGWQQSVSRPGDEIGEREELALRALLNIDINDDASLLLNARYFDDQSDALAATATQTPAGEVTRFSAEDADWSAGHRPKNNNETTGLSATLNWDFGDFSVTSISSFDSFERDKARFDTSGVDYEDANITNSTDIEVFSQELRLESLASESLYWTAGVYYSDDSIEENYLMEFRDSFGLTAESRYQQDSDSVAVFAHAEYQLNETMRLILGARYTDEERSWSGCTFDTGDGLLAGFYNFFVYPVFIEAEFPGASPTASGECALFNDVAGTEGAGSYAPFSQTIDSQESMAKITLDYKPNDDMLVYATLSNGFKSGGFNGAIALSHQMLQPYDTEKLTSYELGIKSTLLDGDMQLNAAAFYYDYQDKQEPAQFISPVGGVVGFTNVPESFSQGLEVEMTWQPSEALRWDISAAYLDTEIEEYIANCPAGLLGSPVVLPEACPSESSFGAVLTYDASGVGLNNAPQWQVSSTLSYNWALNEAFDMSAALDVSYKSDNIGSEAAPDRSTKDRSASGFIPSYTLMNARLALLSNETDWSLTLWGRNITNEYYWHSTGTSNSTSTRINGMPRTYGLTFSYQFN